MLVCGSLHLSLQLRAQSSCLHVSTRYIFYISLELIPLHFIFVEIESRELTMYSLSIYLETMALLMNVVLVEKVPTNRTKSVSMCPCSETEWQRRSDEFKCVKREYACTLNIYGNLVETCMHHRDIKAGETGCPWIGADSNIDTGPIWALKLSACNENVCPKRQHRGYKTNQLYKYPICWIPENKREECTRYMKSCKPCTQNNPPSATVEPPGTEHTTRNKIQQPQYDEILQKMNGTLENLYRKVDMMDKESYRTLMIIFALIAIFITNLAMCLTYLKERGRFREVWINTKDKDKDVIEGGNITN